MLGSPAIVPPFDGHSTIIFTHHLYAARFSKEAEEWKLFAFYSLLQEAFRERAAGFATGTTVLALPRDAVLQAQFAAPPRPLVETFTRIVQPVLSRQWCAMRESQSLASLRDTLLPKLISGELRVKDAERFVAAAT